jgi:hypothetical protein
MSTLYRCIDDNGHILKELDKTGFEAIKAVGLRVAKKHTCMIAKESGGPDPMGSGTFVQRCSRLFVVTVKHLFEDLRSDDLIGIYWGEDDHRAGATCKNVILHDKLDLAAIPLPAGTEVCGVSLRYLQPNHQQSEPDLFVLSNYLKRVVLADNHP